MKFLRAFFVIGLLAIGLIAVKEVSAGPSTANRECGYTGCTDPILIQELCDPGTTCHASAVRYWWRYCSHLPYPC